MNKARKFQGCSGSLVWASALLLTTLVTGCGGDGEGRDPVMGDAGGAYLNPAVTAVAPLAGSVAVPVNTTMITAAFNKPMNPLSITAASFTLACPTSAAIRGTVNYSVSGNVATFTSASNLPVNTVCTASITTGVTDVAGHALAATNWSFTTRTNPDSTAPAMISAVPLANASGVASNSLISAGFNEAMDPATINAANFTLACPVGTAIAGNVAYAVNSRIATFTPSTILPVNTTCTGAISTGAKDMAGNALANPAVWRFTTGALADVLAPTVTLTDPADLTTGVCLDKKITATFSEAIDPLTINSTNFVLTGVSGAVTYSANDRTATFTPTGNLAANTLFAASVSNSVKDLAGNALAINNAWSFTTGAACSAPVLPPPVIPVAAALGAAASFGGFGGGAGMTNQGILTVVNGDIATIAVSTAVTGFHDSVSDVYTESLLNAGKVGGRIYTAPPSAGGAAVGGSAATFVVASAAANAALNAFNSLSPASQPGGVDPGAGQLGGLTLVPGIYTATSGTFLLTGSDLLLDGKGDANAVWVFQTAAGLTVGSPTAPRKVTLINGAQAKNIFWYVGSSARIEDRSYMVGTIIASKGVTISTPGQLATTTLDGRALGLNASVTLVNTIINVPAP